MDIKPGVSGRGRRRHSDEFRARVVEECRRPGVSIASVAMANGLNANLLRNWLVADSKANGLPVPTRSRAKVAPEEFIEVPLVAGPATKATGAAEIRIELRRGTAIVTVTWPLQAAGECAAWLRDWLR